MPDQDDKFDKEGIRLLPPGPGRMSARDEPAEDRARSSVWAAAAGEELDDLDDDPWAPRSGRVTSLSGGDSIDVGLPSGPVEMQDWTEPPTGNVPRVILGADDDWTTRTGSQPRWRGGQDDDWTDSDFDDSLLGEARIGALDESRDDRPDMYSFEDDLPSQPQPVVQLPTSQSSQPSLATDPRASVAPPDVVAPIRTRARGEDGPVPPSSPGRNLPMATIVGGGFALFAGFLFLIGGRLGPWLLATGVVMVCAYELFGVFQRAGLRPANLLGLTSCFALMWAAYAKGVPAVTLVVFLSFVASMLWYLLKVIQARALLGVATTMLGIVWVGVLGSFASLMLVSGRTPSDGRMFLLGAIVCAVASDIGGLAVGSAAGRSLLAPDISPNKTVEGTLGGFALCLLVGIIIGKTSGVWDKSLVNGFLLGLVVGVAAPIGDLAQSLIKRDLGVKDMGTTLPGHGGFLDRFDSLLFALPAVYFLALTILS